jgi:hypothetical protein
VSCPWRVDQDARDITGFDIAKAEALAATCPDERGMGPDFGSTWFACHQSSPGREIVCAGWLARAGRAHPGVRIAVMEGRVPIQALDVAAGWPPLHQTYQEVLAKLRRTCAVRPAGSPGDPPACADVEAAADR